MTTNVSNIIKLFLFTADRPHVEYIHLKNEIKIARNNAEDIAKKNRNKTT